MKNRNLITMTIIIVLCMCSIIFAKKRGYSPVEGYPSINNYPLEIQLMDSMKTELFKNHFRKNGKGLKKEVPDDFIKSFASAYIDFYMQYTNLERKGYKYQYMKETYPIGLKMANEMFKLPYPWSLLLETKGFALAKIIDDKKMPKRKTATTNSLNEYVLEAQIIEDIFNTHEGDTIFVRHNESIFEKYPNYKDMNILFSFRPRGSIQRADSVQFIYVLGGHNEYMFVKDDIIFDPNDVLREENKGYDRFKEDLMQILPTTSKARMLK